MSASGEDERNRPGGVKRSGNRRRPLLQVLRRRNILWQGGRLRDCQPSIRGISIPTLYCSKIIQLQVGMSFSFEMEVKPRTKNAVLLSVGVLEFLTLQIINGTIKFSVDNGAGVESVIYEPPSATSICDGHWHRLSVRNIFLRRNSLN